MTILALIWYFRPRPICITILVGELGGSKKNIMKCWNVIVFYFRGPNSHISEWLLMFWFWRVKFHIAINISPHFIFILVYYAVYFNKKYRTFIYQKKGNFVKNPFLMYPCQNLCTSSHSAVKCFITKHLLCCQAKCKQR